MYSTYGSKMYHEKKDYKDKERYTKYVIIMKAKWNIYIHNVDICIF